MHVVDGDSEVTTVSTLSGKVGKQCVTHIGVTLSRVTNALMIDIQFDMIQSLTLMIQMMNSK